MPRVLLDRLTVAPADLHHATGWEIKPEGACKGSQCVPLPGFTAGPGGEVDVREFAAHMRMPIAADDTHGLWALGPPSGGHVLGTADFPELVLAGFDGAAFDVGALRGRKVLLLAWASW
jgi:hypothetical protein